MAERQPALRGAVTESLAASVPSPKLTVQLISEAFWSYNLRCVFLEPGSWALPRFYHIYINLEFKLIKLSCL